jgi:hypothetical protein
MSLAPRAPPWSRITQVTHRHAGGRARFDGGALWAARVYGDGLTGREHPQCVWVSWQDSAHVCAPLGRAQASARPTTARLSRSIASLLSKLGLQQGGWLAHSTSACWEAITARPVRTTVPALAARVCRLARRPTGICNPSLTRKAARHTQLTPMTTAYPSAIPTPQLGPLPRRHHPHKSHSCSNTPDSPLGRWRRPPRAPTP